MLIGLLGSQKKEFAFINMNGRKHELCNLVPLKLFFYYYYPYKKRQTYATADALKVVFVGVLYNMEQVVVKGIYVD